MQCLRASLWTDRESPTRGSCLRPGTCLPMGTGTTILHGTCACDHWLASPILNRCPTAPRCACWTGRTLLLPLDDKRRGREPRALALLPMSIVPGWPKEINPLVLLTLDDCFCIHRTRIHTMFLWEEIVMLEGFMNVRESSKIGQRCRCRLDRRNQVCKIIITGAGRDGRCTPPSLSRAFSPRGLRDHTESSCSHLPQA